MATTPEPTRELYRVGEIVLDVPSRLVYRRDESMILAPKTFDLLLELVRRGRGIARREELLASVWPGQIVNDETLSQRIRLLRVVLGDDPKHPRYVESVHGWGYRLIADVTPIEQPFTRPSAAPILADDARAEAVESATPTPVIATSLPPSAWRRWRWLLAAAGLAGLLGALLVLGS